MSAQFIVGYAAIMRKVLAATITVLLFVVPLAARAWTNQCPIPVAGEYCANVGKSAYNAVGGTAAFRKVRLGKIIGVIWRPKGSLINKPGGPYNYPAHISPRNAFYYIVDDGAGPEKAFLRMAREIRAE